MQSSLFRSILALSSLALVLGPGVLAQGSAGAERRTAPFRVLDNVEGPHVGLVFGPVRPLLHDEAAGRLYALNTHDSRLLELDTQTGAVLRDVQLPWGPVSVTAWPGDGITPPALLVASRGSYVLARIDRATLAITALVTLPTEPADVVVEPASGHAFVACAGADAVVEVDVGTAEIVAQHAIPSKEPTFLALEGGRVLVAPRLSGNNSICETGPGLLDQGDGRVLDLEDPLVAIQGLPDEDLFGIVPGGAPVALARGMGAVLFALGVNPVTGHVWQLGTDANNKDPDRMGEPAVRGDIVLNQLAIAALSGSGVVEPARVIVLDDTDRVAPGIQHDPARAVGQPYALAFDGAGKGYITGMLTDNVTQLSPAGNFVREWDVGSIPRGIVVNTAGTRAHVHCWGSNEIEVWDLGPSTPALVQTIDLGFDPTPALLREGRRVYFDASNSLHGNASCATCHVDGGTDMLPWDLSGLPFDDKGPLVTQTLVGIADLLPYHWRGERADLIDFNPAFDGLLGGAPLDTAPGGEFDAFQAFVFSLEQPANPNESPHRVIDEAIPFRTPDGALHQARPIAGQDVYFDKNSDVIGSCNFCHTLPTGTNNDVVLDDPTLQDAHRNHKEVASFNGIWRKESPTLETVIFADGSSEARPTIGSAISSAGLVDSLKEFVDIPLFNLSPQERANVVAFVNQVDSGIAPVVHRAWLLGQDAPRLVYGELRAYLLARARARDCDVAVHGTVDLGAGPRELRWSWDRATELFVAEDSTLAPVPLELFFERATAGAGRFVFQALPVGMSERFAIDYDEDDLRNADEFAWGTDPYDPDSDGDGAPDGHEVAHGGDPTDGSVQGNDAVAPGIANARVVYVTTRVAKIAFETTEPARWDASWTNGVQSGATSGSRFEKTHTVLLRTLIPNRFWTVTLRATDPAGNQASLDIANVKTLQVPIPQDTTYQDASVTLLENANGTLRFRVSGRAQRKGGSNANGMQIRVEVFVNGELSQPQVNGNVSAGNGITAVEVTETGLAPGDVVVANIITLWNTQGGQALLWSFPDTPPENRSFAVTYTGTSP